jgi:hypothetical protein
MVGHNNQPIDDTQLIRYFLVLETYVGGKIKTKKPLLHSHLLSIFYSLQNQPNIKCYDKTIPLFIPRFFNITKNIIGGKKQPSLKSII